MPYSMHIMLYTSIYHPLLRIRLEPSCKPVLARLHACAGLWLKYQPAFRESARWTGPPGGLAAPKRPQPRVDLVDIAAPSSVHCCRVCAAKGEAGILALGEHVRDRRSRVTSQKQRDKGDPAHHILDWSHVEAGCRGWFVQLHHPSVLHRPLEGQRELFKCTEEDQGAFNVIRPFFVGSVFRQSPIRWTQNTCEVELWTGIPTVFQGNSVAILLNALGKRRNHNNSILHTGIQLISIGRRKSCDIP